MKLKNVEQVLKYNLSAPFDILTLFDEAQ